MPDRYPFLEGSLGARQTTDRIEAPLVPDGTIHRVLEKLIVLDSERISYRALDVEHIGSVYETMMGFRLERATGRSIAIKAAKKHGAPATINLDELLCQASSSRTKWVKDRTDRQLSAKVGRAVREATTLEELHAALDRVIDRQATPDLVPPGAMVLQPSQERRRSGSHYTPRSLTEPIVRKALDPILDRLAEEQEGPLRPEQILDLKVCDPAMGSAAFLVEACRQLADALIEAWRAHEEAPDLPPGEDQQIFARRLVAQRCLYGVDRNPKAVDLAKLSLWLITLSKDHPLTFLDHALRHGDSLVGLSIPQIRAFHWKGNAPAFQEGFEALRGQQLLADAAELRRWIREEGDTISEREMREAWMESREVTDDLRLLGDLVLAAFFDESTPTAREARRKRFANGVQNGIEGQYRAWMEELRNQDRPLAPLHWQIEFPEVFDRPNPGFDVIVGNPPFAGNNTITASNINRYSHWLKEMHVESHGNSDLVAHFFRRAFNLVRMGGTFGLIATNSISQGDTRSTGLRWICKNGGEIFCVRKRVKWPGQAAVVVSVLHISRGGFHGYRLLDGHSVSKITAFLYYRGKNDDPRSLKANIAKSFLGSIILGMGFTFNDNDKERVATPIREMERLLRSNPSNQVVICPYIGGRELNNNPTQKNHRSVIDFGERSLSKCRFHWPDLLEIVTNKVRPIRIKKRYPRMANEWRKHYAPQLKLYDSIRGLKRVMATCRVSQHMSFAFLSNGMVYADSLVIFSYERFAAFCALQARPHEIWSRFFGSSMKDDLRYTVTDCFETFPLPNSWESRSDFESAGEEYYEFRADLMKFNDEGLTKTYNRFHDPSENDARIIELRRLHAAMDRVVLDAYGWSDIPTDCEFLLDYPIDEDNWGRKKKPYRYRWPDEVRDEVLARLLELNAERAAEEARSGQANPPRGRGRLQKSPPTTSPSNQLTLSPSNGT